STGGDLHADLGSERTEPLVLAGDPLAHPQRLRVLGQACRRTRATRVRGECRRGENGADQGSQQNPQTHRFRVYTGSEHPPSTPSTGPRIIPAPSEQRNAPAPATSSGVTSRPAGLDAPTRSISSRFGKCWSAPVSTTPAETALTRTPGASSTAR